MLADLFLLMETAGKEDSDLMEKVAFATQGQAGGLRKA